MYIPPLHVTTFYIMQFFFMSVCSVCEDLLSGNNILTLFPVWSPQSMCLQWVYEPGETLSLLVSQQGAERCGAGWGPQPGLMQEPRTQRALITSSRDRRGATVHVETLRRYRIVLCNTKHTKRKRNPISVDATACVTNTTSSKLRSLFIKCVNKKKCPTLRLFFSKCSRYSSHISFFKRIIILHILVNV